jgi:Flp pilus assembly protein TadB
MTARVQPASSGVAPVTLVRLQAALEAGASPSEALAACGEDGPLAEPARQAQLGRPMVDIARDVATGDTAADLLVRALALAERTGAGAVQAVEHTLEAIRCESDLARLIAVRTAQARGTAAILAVIPLVTWTVLVAADRHILRFYTTPVGVLTAAVAVVLAVVSWRWMRRMAWACATAAASADLLAPAPLPESGGRAGTAGCVVGVAGAALLGPAGGVVAALLVGGVLARPARTQHNQHHEGGAADLVDLVGVAVTTGLPVVAAVEEVACVAPPRAAAALRPVTARLAAGWRLEEAFADTPLASLGQVLAAGVQWGAPVAPPLRRLADDLRADRRAAAELAAERLQLALVFPTTLLTLPAFVLGVVPPLLWATLQR